MMEGPLNVKWFKVDTGEVDTFVIRPLHVILSNACQIDTVSYTSIQYPVAYSVDILAT